MMRSRPFSTLFPSDTGGSKAMFWQWDSCGSRAASRRSIILCTVLWLAVLGPGRAAAELPLLSLGAPGDRQILNDLLVGSHQMGMGVLLPSPCTDETDGLAIETRQRYDNAAISIDAAYWTNFARQRDDLPLGVSTQLGLHVRTATRDTEIAGLGPSLGLRARAHSCARRTRRLGGHPARLRAPADRRSHAWNRAHPLPLSWPHRSAVAYAPVPVRSSRSGTKPPKTMRRWS